MIFLHATIGASSSLLAIVDAFPAYERTKPILEALPEVTETKTDPGDLSGRIELSHVSFRYKADGPLVLVDFSLQIKAGEFVALVGPSGSGKSTLMRLLLGFETPESGKLYYDGQDLAGLDMRAVRRQCGVVLQNGRLMPGDIYQNIVGTSLLTLEDAWEAARMAGLEKDIYEMPMGMHTVLGEGSSTLSGGQRQRLMIARAIVAKPRIVLLDEATSALDNRTQAIVTRSLEGLKATRIVIAHRLSTVQRAERICVVVKGRLVQSGTFEELAGRPGPFAELARRQLA
jgi:ABC-type bacteriocin/lantibiotic exporter with double-glycine peptidase domain